MEIRIADGRTIPVVAGESIYEALRHNGIYLVASCGGKGVCGKCHVKVIEGKSHVEVSSRLRKKERDENIALACKTFPQEDILIEIPEDAKLVIGDKIAVSKSKDLLEFLHAEEPEFTPPVRCTLLNLPPPSIHDNISDLERVKKALDEKGIHGMRFSHDFVTSMSKSLRDANWNVSLAYTDELEAFALSHAECMNKYGIAVDIGTTTVVLYLINCYDGSLVDVGMTYNSQMRYGDDVITRIVHATEGGGILELQHAVVDDINDMLLPVLEKNAVSRDDVVAAVISGNTTMSQLFWGLDPSSIREEPYIPTINIFPVWRAGTARIKMNSQAPVYTLPSVGSYVGGDIVAGVLASRMHRNPEVALFRYRYKRRDSRGQ